MQAAQGQPTTGAKLLITAGPTHEPIDSVRYIGNRSSGRLGVALADAAAARGWDVTLLLGPSHLRPADGSVGVYPFVTASDLGDLLESHQPKADVLIMAAAVADFRPVTAETGGKLRREAAGMTLRLEATEDLLAACSARRPDGQRLVGFALEPRDRLLASAREKLARKGVDLIVANPLETMESEMVEATLIGPEGVVAATAGPLPKAAFAAWLLSRLEAGVRPSADR